MRLNKQSIDNILKGAAEVMVYGMDSCEYDSVSEALDNLGFHVYRGLSTQFPQSLPYSPSTYPTKNTWKRDIGDKCKNTLINLIFENYKRSKTGTPIIPLLFCIEIESDSSHSKLNPSRLFRTETSVTNKELRRCFRIMAETSPEIQMIAMETFKFVKVKQNSTDQQEYSLEEVPPFWVSDEFKTNWQSRISNTDRDSQKRAQASPKLFKWKNELISSIRLFDAEIATVNTTTSASSNHSTEASAAASAASWRLPCTLL